MPDPLPRIKWTPGKWALLTIALLASAYFFWTVNSGSLRMVAKFFAPHNGPVVIPWPTDPEVVKKSFWYDLKLVAAGVVVLLCMLGIAGKRAVGLDMGNWRLHRIGLGFYLRTVFPYSLLLPALTILLSMNFPKLMDYTAHRSGTAPKHETYEIFLSFAGGFTTEIIVTVFVYWLLSFVPWRTRKGTTNLAATGWGTAIIVLASVSHLTYYGISMWWMAVAAYFTVICWRYTRSLVALVAGHTLWDLLALVPTGNFYAKIVLAGASVAIGLSLDWYWKAKVPAEQSA